MRTSTLGLSAAAAFAFAFLVPVVAAPLGGPRPVILPHATAGHAPQHVGAVGHPTPPAPPNALAQNGRPPFIHGNAAWRRARGYLPYGDTFVGYGADQLTADEGPGPDAQTTPPADDNGGPRVYLAPPQASYPWPQPHVAANPGPKIIYIGKQAPRRHGKLPVVIYGIPPGYQVD